MLDNVALKADLAGDPRKGSRAKGRGVRLRLLPLAVTMLATSLCASVATAQIDLSQFNSAQVRIHTGDMLFQNTMVDGSKSTYLWDGIDYTTQYWDIVRGHFVGNTYTANWDFSAPVPGGTEIRRGSISITLSATDPPTITQYSINAYAVEPSYGAFIGDRKSVV